MRHHVAISHLIQQLSARVTVIEILTPSPAVSVVEVDLAQRN